MMLHMAVAGTGHKVRFPAIIFLAWKDWRIGKGKPDMKISQLSIEKIENYDPFNKRARANGMVTEWVARNEWGNAVAFGNTKVECIADARRYCKRKNVEDKNE